MAAVLRIVLTCQGEGCGMEFTALSKSPGRVDMLCFWCWLLRMED
jgi:hypothetical protein